MDGCRLGGLSQDTDVCDHGPSAGDAETSLCDKCVVLRIDDKKWGGGVEKHDDGRGPPFVIFPDIVDIFGPEERIELVYEREDTYPDLLELEQGSMNGCEFCKLLRESLQEKWAVYKITRQGFIRIHTRKISYEWTRMRTITRFSGQEPRPPKSRRGNLKLDFDLIHDTAPPVPHTLLFEFFSDQGPLASWLRIHRDLPPISYLHPKVLSQIKGWLGSTSQCVDFSNETQSVPTRLIDVGPSDGTQQPRLVISQDDLPMSLRKTCSYAALSYCWGEREDRQLKTTKCVMERFRREIPLESCPESFRDAIKFVRAIGLRYLWIDALCIIQGDKRDWERESLKMYEVYSQAHLTIVPLKSKSPKMGFLERDQRPRMEMHFISTLNPRINGSIWLQPTLTCSWDWQGAPWLSMHDQRTSRWVTRAWTLQESEFSRRLLYFGNNVVSLQTYNGHKFSDNGQIPNTETPLHVDKGPSLRSCLEANDGIKGAWDSLIESYADRNLTYPRDRLPAISALASLIQNRTKDDYLAGLWLSHLHHHLFWQTAEESKIAIAELVRHLWKPKPYIAPSWSWARMKQKVHLPTFDEYKSELQVSEAETESEGSNTFGAVSRGHLLLLGKLYRLKNFSLVREGNNVKLLVEERFFTYVDIDGALEDEEELPANESEDPPSYRLSTISLSNMAMLLIARAKHRLAITTAHGRQVFCGLLLVPKENGPDWLRIGTFTSYSEWTGNFFDSCETVDVKIV